MNRALIAILVALLPVSSAWAQEHTTITPDGLGGYRTRTFDYNNGNVTTGTVQPDGLGGWRTRTFDYGSGGVTRGTVTPDGLGGYRTRSFGY
jgi:hypothetical protein